MFCINNIKIRNKNELKEIDIENCTCNYFDDIIIDRDIYLVNMSIDKKSYETYKKFLVYNISCKPSTGWKPLHIRFDKIDGFIRILDGEIKHLV